MWVSFEVSAISSDYCGVGQTTIDDLPDDALLEIFDFYLDDKSFYSADKWHTLVHVCRWWRSVVFSSPCRLDLRLFCLGRRSVRAMLDIGLDLPIQIDYHCGWMYAPEMMLNNVITALEHPDRVRHISIRNFPEAWEEALVGAMQVPFPELTYLRLEANFPYHECPFEGKVLGRSAPRLRTLQLEYISFQAARGLILSARDLVDLTLLHIPRWGHVPARSLVACLSSLNRLESLWLVTKVAESPRSRPNQPGDLRLRVHGHASGHAQFSPLSPSFPLKAGAGTWRTSSHVSIPPCSANSTCHLALTGTPSLAFRISHSLWVAQYGSSRARVPE
ncbi:hypothetical protein BC826DRAFT_464135 [Russula brevipes]|nr:hypothetical protein BC826DRAFT_464135 [Russula brevipes]